MSTQAWNICATPHRGSIIVNVYLTSAFVFLASIAKANGISRRIASEREGLSFCCLAQALASQKSLPSRSAIKLAFFDNPLVRHAVEDSVMKFDCAAPAERLITKRKGGNTAVHRLSLLCHYRRGYSLCHRGFSGHSAHSVVDAGRQDPLQQ